MRSLILLIPTIGMLITSMTHAELGSTIREVRLAGDDETYTMVNLIGHTLGPDNPEQGQISLNIHPAGAREEYMYSKIENHSRFPVRLFSGLGYLEAKEKVVEPRKSDLVMWNPDFPWLLVSSGSRQITEEKFYTVVHKFFDDILGDAMHIDSPQHNGLTASSSDLGQLKRKNSLEGDPVQSTRRVRSRYTFDDKYPVS
ncbi:hypothetical protein MJO28_010343 [Puccinia striiformis f. sp. tritici]|uniref:Secreted protein n=4 Tax=Puccinia striiformis TaxID=27350 RepID=A0A0L0W2I7_9BASI|nr:hypothetical protein Pst134EA_019144 [Puccinia striiformis f. sp. tritici]KNF05692.1 hypothetical protein PSTG_01095 [Puccinia striiformis f. sp. tritici PST-78]POW02199.1 hypothetical protein PSTT_11925 [Puccinia striiformis]KAH9449238.1 hypothetical protein Pst134EB_020063 [Puccinia striiformis f. sp. tritici]KAH9458992.1 hypothetical protein Pst134EA_019144 [Puccinia striiformis f. sp. tritici]KAI7944648.1 hypothetical protein MJO28_010343 [Puccinia striiformis f. sp. tritici]